MEKKENDIDQVEDVFNINEVLTDLFSATKHIAQEKNIELIYEMGPNTPRKLRGDSERLLQILNKIFTFVFQNTNKKDIVLSLSSPEDFLYEEFISFYIKETDIPKEKLLVFLETDLNKDIEILGAEIIMNNENSSDIHLSIPFKNFELGFRRHYRLPDKNIVGKKMLLLCANDKTAQSIKKMFEYFHYDITVSMEESKKKGNTLATYDLLVISKKIFTEKNKKVITAAQESSALKYVLLQEPKDLEEGEETDTAHFIKPITQEKIFDLIVSLFNDDLHTQKLEIVLTEGT